MSDNIQEELDRLDKFNSPMAIIKKAFSSFGVILLIGGGMVFSFILGVVYLLGWGAIVPTVWLLGGLVLLMLVFPAAYLFAAFTFGRALIFWEAFINVFLKSALYLSILVLSLSIRLTEVFSVSKSISSLFSILDRLNC